MGAGVQSEMEGHRDQQREDKGRSQREIWDMDKNGGRDTARECGEGTDGLF